MTFVVVGHCWSLNILENGVGVFLQPCLSSAALHTAYVASTKQSLCGVGLVLGILTGSPYPRFQLPVL